jgi:hypothetical protein
MHARAMPPEPDPALGHLCPHVDKNDPRCQSRFRMGELDVMYRYCLGGFYGCVLFHRINREAAYGSAQPVTVHGRPLGVRRTGS